MDSDDYDLLNHFTVLIYPFVHKINGDTRRRHVTVLSESWAPWWTRLNERQTVAALDDTYFFLPYIRETIFPETKALKDIPSGADYLNWRREIEKWSRGGLGHFCNELPPQAAIRMTLKHEILSPGTALKLIGEPDAEGGGRSELPVRLDWIDAIIFTSGIGFIVLKLEVDGRIVRLSDLTELNYGLSTVHAPTLGWILPKLSVGGAVPSMSVRDLMDFLTQGIVDEGGVNRDLHQFVDELRRPAKKRYTDTEVGQVYGERCHLLTYACTNNLEDANQADEAPFDSTKDRLLFELAHSLAPGDSLKNPTWVPAASQLRRLEEQNIIAVWENWSGMILKDSVAFLATKGDDFARQVLPHNIESDYLPLYLYTLHQKFSLYVFSNELTRAGAYATRNLREVWTLMDRFMDFRNKYWFNEITLKPLGAELYSKLQYGIEVTSLYDLVSVEVKELKEYYEWRRQKRMDLLLNLFSFVFLPVGVVVGIFGMTFFSGSWLSFIVTCLMVVAVSVGLWRWWAEENRFEE
ncbi:MAG TPA: hypothetical protein VLJ61_05760 [Pyrinomonadaceae bacterium]|nr:hypothetical protein [Pyrinomonadaceae bacterium]